MKMEQTERSERLAYKIQMPGNYPEENIQHTEHGKFEIRKQWPLGPVECKSTVVAMEITGKMFSYVCDCS
jgi:hypothetical protein